MWAHRAAGLALIQKTRLMRNQTSAASEKKDFFGKMQQFSELQAKHERFNRETGMAGNTDNCTATYCNSVQLSHHRAAGTQLQSLLCVWVSNTTDHEGALSAAASCGFLPAARSLG